MDDKIDLCIKCAAKALTRFEKRMERADMTWPDMYPLERDDVEQEARIAALEAYDGFDETRGDQSISRDSRLRQHLVCRAGYRIRDMHRNANKLEVGHLEFDDRVDPDPTPAHRLMADERATLATMAACLTTVLPKEQMVIIRGRFGLDGRSLTCREIAEELGLSVTRVMVLFDEAMEVLRAEMRAEEILGG